MRGARLRRPVENDALGAADRETADGGVHAQWRQRAQRRLLGGCRWCEQSDACACAQYRLERSQARS
jgi:hypothetical protein